jgi:hypothetical protein
MIDTVTMMTASDTGRHCNQRQRPIIMISTRSEAG